MVDRLVKNATMVVWVVRGNPARLASYKATMVGWEAKKATSVGWLIEKPTMVGRFVEKASVGKR